MPGVARDEWEGKELIVDNITKDYWISVGLCWCEGCRLKSTGRILGQSCFS